MKIQLFIEKLVRSDSEEKFYYKKHVTKYYLS